MRTCSPSEFLGRWPGSLRPIVFPEPPPALPDDCRRLLAEFGLPGELTIYCYNDITLEFTGRATPFATIWDRDLKRGYKMGDMPGEWTRFWHLADEEYVQGGGWLCIEEVTGRLVVIDTNSCTDYRDAVILLNSSVRSFYTTLAYFLDWSEKTSGSPAETAALRDALIRQQCIPVAELDPFWMNFIHANLDYVMDGHPKLAVSVLPKNA
jgi:hypothetical protein